MKVLVNFAFVLVLILCFVNIASSHHAQGNVPRMEAPLPVMESAAPTETTNAPLEAVVIPASTTPQETPGYFELLLDQLKSFFVAEETNSTVVVPSDVMVEQVVLA
ncbi:unnamed protein product [Diamesa serratosioi]